MNGGSVYCMRCKIYVPLNGNVGDYCCPTCGGKTKIGESPRSTVHREANRGESQFQLHLTEVLMDLGFSEAEAKAAAQNRGNDELPPGFDGAKFEASLTESFMRMGMDEGSAKQAARGRGGLELIGTPDDEEKLRDS